MHRPRSPVNPKRRALRVIPRPAYKYECEHPAWARVLPKDTGAMRRRIAELRPGGGFVETVDLAAKRRAVHGIGPFAVNSDRVQRDT